MSILERLYARQKSRRSRGKGWRFPEQGGGNTTRTLTKAELLPKGRKRMGKILEAIATDHLCVEPVIYEGDSKFNRARNRYCTLGEKLMAKLNEEVILCTKPCQTEPRSV